MRKNSVLNGKRHFTSLKNLSLLIKLENESLYGIFDSVQTVQKTHTKKQNVSCWSGLRACVAGCTVLASAAAAALAFFRLSPPPITAPALSVLYFLFVFYRSSTSTSDSRSLRYAERSERKVVAELVKQLQVKTDEAADLMGQNEDLRHELNHLRHRLELKGGEITALIRHFDDATQRDALTQQVGARMAALRKARETNTQSYPLD